MSPHPAPPPWARRKAIGLALAGLLVTSSPITRAEALDEGLFLDDLPVVLTVSRLAQPLDEAPGAVSVITRDMIRRSGARELAELLRLVPGFLVAHFDGGARPFATYHADYDAFNRHLQVYIDGRSIYSGLFLGNAAYGMMGVVLEDIERIEVLRGSNSAAFGANAFLGVINIITRHAEDSQGKSLNLNLGEQGVRDLTARLGWNGGQSAYRLTLASRNDTGFPGIYDDKHVDQVHFRGDLRPSRQDELTLAAGLTRFEWGVFPFPPLPSHDETWENAYVHGQWRRELDPVQTVQVSALLDHEDYGNFYPGLRADGQTRRLSLEAQHTAVLNANWRTVWGGQYRSERIASDYLFADQPEQQNHVWRLFGNVEWRLHPDWLVNAGGLWEKHSIVGVQSAPRLTLHWHVLPDHTLRIGRTSAYKTPGQFELRGHWRAPYPLLGPVTYVRATGQAKPEKIKARELGYLGQFRPLGLTLDLRVFEERVESTLGFSGPTPRDVSNDGPNRQRGWETQLRWRPLAGTEFLVNHTQLELVPDAVGGHASDADRAPRTVSTLALLQRLPGQYDLSLIYYRVGKMFWVSQGRPVPAFGQMDVRLARGLELAGNEAEIALTVQAANGSHLDYTPDFRLGRRAFLSLRLEL